MSTNIDRNILKELYEGSEDLVFPPMLIHSSTDSQLKEASNSNEYFAQIKKDGAFYQYVKGTNGKSYLFGRTVSKKTKVFTEKGANVPHIMSALDKVLPNKTVIVGEIYYPNKSSKDTVSIMGCLAEKAIERQNSSNYGKIKYYIHDILMYDGISFIKAKTPNWTRYKILKALWEKDIKKIAGDYITFAFAWEDNIYERIGDVLFAGEEGMVLKKKNGIYEPDKRPLTNLKAKKIDFADVIIIGFESPTKEYYGKEIENWEYWINNITGEKYKPSFLYEKYLEDSCLYQPVTKPYYMDWKNSRIKIGAIDKNGKIINIGTIHSGISDHMKKDMSINPEKYLNKVCSVQMMEKDNKEHTIRHGFFKYMREDKNFYDCKMEDIFNF